MRTARFRRLVPAAAAAALAAAATVASAATLGGLDAAGLAAAGRPIPSCDAAFAIQPATSGGNVVSVTVGDVADACEGGDVHVTLTDGAGAVVAAGGPEAIPVDGDALPSDVLVAVAPTPPAEQVDGAHVLVVGP